MTDIPDHRTEPLVGCPGAVSGRPVNPGERRLNLSRRLTWFLDFARWTSAFAVLLFHARGAILVHWTDVENHTPWLSLVYFASTLGHEAVMIFFVLSGFLVGGSVLASWEANDFEFRIYLANRISRIYAVLPAALLVGAAIDLAGVTWIGYAPIPSHGTTAAHTIGDHLSWRIGLANLLNLQTIFAPPLGTNGVLWSLANEFWYYLMFPFLVMAIRRDRPVWRRLLAGFGFALLFTMVSWGIRLYFGIWLLGVAVWLARRPVFRSARAASVLLVASLVVAAGLPRISLLADWLPSGDAVTLPGDAAVALAFANLLLTVKWQRDVEPVWRQGQRINRRMANFSYSLYLFHAPFLYFITAAYQARVPPLWVRVMPTGEGLLVFMGFIVLTYLYCFGLSMLTERHSGRLRAVLYRLMHVDAGAAPRLGERAA